MESKIDIDKFICDLFSIEFNDDEKEKIQWKCESGSIYAPLYVAFMAIEKALKSQGLEYKDGKIVELDQQPLTEEQKPNPCENCSIATNNCQKFPCAIRYGEQKPADKIEPKFKVEKDKWYVCTSQYCNCIEGRNYKASLDGRIIDDYGTEYDMHSDAYRWFRPWTIQDAKDGDVLAETYNEQGKPWIGIFKCFNDRCPVESFNSYCFITSGEHSFVTPSSCFYNRCVGHGCSHTRPATSDECKILFSKMSEAGYLWDTNKNELKLKNKSAWSDEDEAVLDALIRRLEGEDIHVSPHLAVKCLKSLKGRVQLQPKQEWSEEDESHIRYLIECLEHCKKGVALTMTTSTSQEYINWLKSLSPRSYWKPSDEQMDAVRIAAEIGTANNSWAMSILKGLYQDLKKL